MKPISNEEFERFKNMCLNQDGWTHASTTGAVDIFTMQTESSSTLRLKLISKSFDDIELDTIFEVLMDTAFRTQWDPNVMHKKIIEVIDDYNEIQYYQVKMPIVANRDFLYIKAWRYSPDEFIIFNRSIEDEREPPRNDFVRAFFHDCGYYVRKEEGRPILYYVLHNEWNGWIPSFFINRIGLSFCPSVIDKLVDGCHKYDNWKKEQKDHQAPWRKLMQKAEE